MRPYLNLVRRIIDEGEIKEDRTGTGTYSISGAEFTHDMAHRFPLLTTKQTAFRVMLVELEGFLNGITDKKWYQDRNCHIWDEWCNPKIVPYAHDFGTKKRMMDERDLGPIYGFQWRHFGAKYRGYNEDYTGEGIDQLKEYVVEPLKTRNFDRRMLVSAWNPLDIPQMALPPCHYAWQVLVRGNKLDLRWDQRSVDTMLGLPFNIASYATLLHLLAKEAGLEEGILTGHLGDVHIYRNHVDQAVIQAGRQPFPLPTIETPDFTSIFDWDHTQTKIIDYKHHPKIEFPIAV